MARLQIETLGKSACSHSLPIWTRVLHGEILIVREGLQQLGLIEQLLQISRAAVGYAAGSVIESRVSEKGFERIHAFVQNDELVRVAETIYEKLEPLAPSLGKVLARQILGWWLPIFVEKRPNVRLQVPFDSEFRQRANKSLHDYKKLRGDGKLTPHAPHRDSWFNCPDNAINFWVAMGEVVAGNSLVLYPDLLHKDVPVDENGHVVGGAHLGTVEIPNLKAGDVLVFRGEHLHASEINTSQITRYVVSLRVTLGRPRMVRRHVHHYVYTGLAHGGLRKWAEYPARFSTTYLREWLSAHPRNASSLALLLNRILPPLRSRNGTFPLFIPQLPVTQIQPNVAQLSLACLKVNVMTPIGKSVCIVRTSTGSAHVVSRYCTHEGADLAFARVQDGCVICPWHNARFDLRTGEGPCGLRKLKVYECNVQDENVSITPNPVSSLTGELT